MTLVSVGSLAYAARRAIIGLLSSTIRFSGSVVPRHRSAVIRTLPDYDDMLRAVTPGLLDRGLRVTVLVEAGGPVRPKWLPRQADIVPVRSAKGVWRYLRAREVYFTHGLYGSPKPGRNQTVVNLWHGMPLKRIDRHGPAGPPRFSFTIASSEDFADILAGSFNVPKEDVEVIGLPRNDILVDPAVPDGRLILQEFNVSKYVLMLPTFRSTTLGPLWVDGSDAALHVGSKQLQLLGRVLSRNGVLLLVKPHPLAPTGSMNSWRGPSISVIDQSWLDARGLTIYGVLGGASALITDYSSVAVDFLVTGRPCILYQPDAADYEARRGLTVVDEAWDALGPRVTDIEGLAHQIDVLSSGEHQRPVEPSAPFCTVPPTGATARLFRAVEARAGPYPLEASKVQI